MGIPTPGQSLIPQIPASVGFGTAFTFGWLVHRSSDALAAIAQRWFANLVHRDRRHRLAAAHHARQRPMAQPGLTKTLYALVFGVAVWGWVLGLTGAALRFLSNYSAVRRYIADASYWIYLAHLPVVAALAGLGRPLAAALGREVSVHPRGELRGAVPELSLPGAPDLHRAVAQRPQVSAQSALPPGSTRLACVTAARGYRRRRTGRPAARHHQEVRRRDRASTRSTSKCVAANCWRCSGPMAPASPRRSRCGWASSKPTPAKSRCSAVIRRMSTGAADSA